MIDVPVIPDMVLSSWQTWRVVPTGDLVTVSKTLFIRTQASQTTSRTQRRSLLEATSTRSRDIVNSELQSILEATTFNRSVPTRHVTPENQLVSGLFLHQTRKPSYSLCDRFFASKLAHECLLQRLAAPLSMGSFARTATDPFGTDPVFNPRSSMYVSQTAQNVWQYYNASAAAEEVAPTGTPYGFFSRETMGYPHGFPVTFPVCHCCGNQLACALDCVAAEPL